MKNGSVERDAGETPEILLKKLEQHIAGWLSNEETGTVNGRRTEILKHCLACGGLERGMFQLTVPTGGGKTIASLAFALRHAVENGLDRVIYVILIQVLLNRMQTYSERFWEIGTYWKITAMWIMKAPRK